MRLGCFRMYNRWIDFHIVIVKSGCCCSLILLLILLFNASEAEFSQPSAAPPLDSIYHSSFSAVVANTIIAIAVGQKPRALVHFQLGPSGRPLRPTTRMAVHVLHGEYELAAFLAERQPGLPHLHIGPQNGQVCTSSAPQTQTPPARGTVPISATAAWRASTGHPCATRGRREGLSFAEGDLEGREQRRGQQHGTARLGNVGGHQHQHAAQQLAIR